MSSQSPRVMIVEDDALTGLVLSEYLEAHGFPTTVVRDGFDAFTRFAAERPDIVFLDLHLPGRDGFTVCCAIKNSAHGKKTPVVLMSALLRDTDQAMRYTRGLRADGYLQKPFDLDLIVKRVHELVGRP